MSDQRHPPEMTEEEQEWFGEGTGVPYAPGPAESQLAVIQSAYFLPANGEDATGTEVRSVLPLSTEEEPYRRRLKVGPAWQALDYGWVESHPSLVMLHYLADDSPVNLSAEETQRKGRQVIELALDFSHPNREDVAHLLLAPNEAQLLRPAPGVTVYLRCLHGPVFCVAFVFPSPQKKDRPRG